MVFEWAIMLTWQELQGMYMQLERLRRSVSQRDPIDSPLHRRTERAAMKLEEQLARAIRDETVLRLQQDLRQRQSVSCSSTRV